MREGRHSGELSLSSLEEESKERLHSTNSGIVVSLESTPLDCTKFYNTVYKPIWLTCILFVIGTNKDYTNSYLVHFIPEIPIAYLDLVFSMDANPPYIYDNSIIWYFDRIDSIFAKIASWPNFKLFRPKLSPNRTKNG